MEFNSKFAILQGVLKCQEKAHGKLISIRPEDERKIEEIKSAISKALEGEQLNSHDLRQIYLFLLLNTNTDYYNIFRDNVNYGHLVGSVPQLSKLLFIECAIHLKLETFLYESVLFLPTLLSLEVIDSCLILLKFMKDPFKMFPIITVFGSAIITRLFVLEKEAENSNDLEVKTKFFEYFQSIMERYTTTKSDQFTSWPKNKLNYFGACVMKSILKIVKECCKYFLKPEIENEDFQTIYRSITCEASLKNKVKIGAVDNIMKTSLELVLSTLLSTARCVTIDLWMSWLEMEEFTEENLQATIGNEVYYCLQYLKEENIEKEVNPHLYSEITIVSNMSIKPINEDDEIHSADISTMIENINNSAKSELSSSKWLSALIMHSDFNPDSTTLNLISEKSHLLTLKNIEILVVKYHSFVNQGSVEAVPQQFCEVQDLYKKIILSSVKNFHIDNQVVFLEHYVNKYGLTNILALPEFDSLMTEVFNKAVPETTQSMEFFTEFICLSLQSPESLLNKIVKEALSSCQQGRMMANILKYLQPICSFKMDKTDDEIFLIKILKRSIENINDLSGAEKENFVNFIVRLLNKSIIPRHDFLIICLWPKLMEAVKQYDYSTASVWLDLLKKFVDNSIKLNDFELNMPLHIISLCYILDKSRCPLSNFCTKSMAICDKVLSVLIEYLEMFSPEEVQENVMGWMKNQLQSKHMITQIHVLSFIHLPEVNYLIDSKSKDVHWLKLMFWESDDDLSFLDDMRRSMFIRVLYKVLPYLTLREWKIMFSNLTAKDDVESIKSLFLATADAVLMLQSSIRPNMTADRFEPRAINSISNCLCFVMKNLICIVQDSIFPEVKKIREDDLAEIFFKLCCVLNNFPQAAESENNMLVWLKILQDLITFAELPKVDEKSGIMSGTTKFCAGIRLITNETLRKSLFNSIMQGPK